MSVIKPLFGAAGVAITCTVTSLANGSFRQSTVVDNSASPFLDALVQVVVKTNAAGTSASGFVAVYVYATSNFGGANLYPDGITGTDGAYTALATTPNLIPLGPLLNCTSNATIYTTNPMSVSAAFGGTMPDHWGIVVENETGAALDGATGSAWYQGRNDQVV